LAQYIVEAVNLCYRYGDGTDALQGVNLAVKNNSRAAILGPNGAGKSTLLLHFNGLLKPFKGKLSYRGVDYQYTGSSLKNLKKLVGIVFQNPDNQLFSASVLQDISFGLLNLGYSKEEAMTRIERVGRELGILDLFNKPTHFLSVGQKKLVALAGVLVMEPEILICDEPTAGLDPANANRLIRLLNKLYQQGLTIIISTHDVDLAYSWADTVFILANGRVLAGGSPMDVFLSQSTLSNTGLHKPWVLETWEELKRVGFLKAETIPPHTKEELFMALNSLR